MRSHRDLDVWKLSIQLVTDIYEELENFPKSELYGLTSQIKRSAVSVPSNIAEGAARNSKAEFARFLNISLGSLAELETQLIISENLSFMNSKKFDEQIVTIRKMIAGLLKSLKQ